MAAAEAVRKCEADETAAAKKAAEEAIAFAKETQRKRAAAVAVVSANTTERYASQKADNSSWGPNSRKHTWLWASFVETLQIIVSNYGLHVQAVLTDAICWACKRRDRRQSKNIRQCGHEAMWLRPMQHDMLMHPAFHTCRAEARGSAALMKTALNKASKKADSHLEVSPEISSRTKVGIRPSRLSFRFST